MIKKIILVALLAIVANAGVWTSVSGFATKEINPDATYTVDTIGQNPRVYEFTPKGNPTYVCIALFTEGAYKAPVMQCIPKKEKTTTK